MLMSGVSSAIEQEAGRLFRTYTAYLVLQNVYTCYALGKPVLTFGTSAGD